MAAPADCGLGHHPVDFRRAGQVVAERDAGNAGRGIDGRLGLHLPGVPEREDEAVVDLDEEHLAGDFPVDGPSKAIHIEAAGGVNTADTQ